ncbi:MAG: hypothetical protein ACI8ZN_002104 [Bacteroidia bacterium]|jgi:hypothetical protein
MSFSTHIPYKLGSILIILLLLWLFVGCNNSSNNTTQFTMSSTNDSLRGMWALSAFEYYDSTGTWKPYAWNEGGTGYLVYDGIEHGALHITPKDYANFVEPLMSYTWKDSLMIDSVLAYYKSNYNYMARYEIDSVHRIISHTRLSHSWSKDWGKTVQRRFAFTGKDSLWLFPMEGEKPRRLLWVRP